MTRTETAPFPSTWDRLLSPPAYPWFVFILGVLVSFLTAASVQRAVLGMYGLKLGPVEVPELPESTTKEAITAARDSKRERLALNGPTIPDESIDELPEASQVVAESETDAAPNMHTNRDSVGTGDDPEVDEDAGSTSENETFEDPEASQAAPPRPIPAAQSARLLQAARRRIRNAWEADARIEPGWAEQKSRVYAGDDASLFQLRLDLEGELTLLLGDSRVRAAGSISDSIDALRNRGLLSEELAESLLVLMQRLDQFAHGVRANEVQRGALVFSGASILDDLRVLRGRAGQIFAKHVANHLRRSLEGVHVSEEASLPPRGRRIDILVSDPISRRFVAIEVMPALTPERLAKVAALKQEVQRYEDADGSLVVVAGDATFPRVRSSFPSLGLDQLGLCLWDQEWSNLVNIVLDHLTAPDPA